MKRREYTKNRREFIIEEFGSFEELIRICKGRKRNFGRHQKDDGDGTFKDPEWIGAKSYKEASDLLKYGWQDNEKITILNDRVRNLSKHHESQKIGFKNDIVGFAPVVPNAIIGIPQNMINSVRVPKKTKVITILADMTVSANTPQEEYLEWGAKLISKIVQLEKNGFRVRLEYVNTFADDGCGKVHACRILMKSENQPFDIKRYMFPLAHTAMFRGLMFDWYEKLPKAEQIFGYGSSLYNHRRDNEFIRNEVAPEDNCYYIICKEDIEEALKGVA